MSEARVLAEIRLALGREPGLRLFRNNVGKLRDGEGRVVTFGLHPGSGDLIGWRSVVVTPDMLGRTLAVFVSIEVKDKGRPTPEQRAWAAAVTAAGGFAGVARTPDDARLALGLLPTMGLTMAVPAGQVHP